MVFRHVRPSSCRRRRRTLAALPAPRYDEDLAARRARGVRSKPRINTNDVETVAALRQHADLVAVGVLRQADRTLRTTAASYGGGAEGGGTELLVKGVLWK